jgi:hypothetical protein
MNFKTGLSLLFFSLLAASSMSASLPKPRFHVGTDIGILGWNLLSQGPSTVVIDNPAPTYSIGLDLRLEAPIAKYFHILGMYNFNYLEEKQSQPPNQRFNELQVNLGVGLKVPVPISTEFGLIEPYFLLPIGSGINMHFPTGPQDDFLFNMGLNLRPSLGVQFLLGEKFGFFVEGGVSTTMFGNTRLNANQRPVQISVVTLRPIVNAGFTMTL